MTEPEFSVLKRSKLLSIIAATLEYFISILVASSFLATLTKELGVSDSLTGILSSVISLGCLFQLLSISIRKTTVKRIVIIFSIINQALFMLLYAIPLTNFEKSIKITVFVVLIFSAYLIYNIAHPKKINWLMSLVENNHRGRFTANKEMISLISGIIFSFSMGAVIDYFSNIGKIRVAFIISTIVIFVLMVLHSLTMIFSIETPTSHQTKKDLKQTIIELVKNKNILHITVVFFVVLYLYLCFYSFLRYIPNK